MKLCGCFFLGAWAVAFSLPGAAFEKPPVPPEIRATQAKMEAIMFSRVDFDEATVAEMAAWMSAESKKLDPQGKGIEVLIEPSTLEHEAKTRPDVLLKEKKLTLRLNDASMDKTVKVMATLLALRHRVGDGKIYLSRLMQ